jgi:hypothetical protein
MVGVLAILAVVQTGSLFSADAWNNVTYTAGEVRNPKRNLPLSLALGTILVLGLYILANFVYLLALPLHGDPQGATIFSRGIQYASEDRVATAVLQQILSEVAHARRRAAGAGRVDLPALHLRFLFAVARLHHLHGADLLHPHHRQSLRAAREAPQRRAPLSRDWLSRAARALYPDGRVDLYRIIALQTAIHMARTRNRAARHSRLRRVVPQVGF